MKIRKKFLPKKKTKITTTLRLQENAKKQKKNVFWTQSKPLNEQLMQISYRKAVQEVQAVQARPSIHIDIGVQYMSLRRPTVCQYRERELT